MISLSRLLQDHQAWHLWYSVRNNGCLLPPKGGGGAFVSTKFSDVFVSVLTPFK